MLSASNRLLRRNSCKIFYHQKRVPDSRTLCQSPFHSSGGASSFHSSPSLSPFHIRQQTPPLAFGYSTSHTLIYPQARRSISSSKFCQSEGDPADEDWYVDLRKPRWRKSGWEMQRRRFNRHVTNLVKKKKVEEAEEVLHHMLQASVHPDVVIFNTIIAGYGRKGDIRKAFKLYNDMKKRSIAPTVRTYTSLLNGCTRAGLKSLDYLDKIRDEIDQNDIILNDIAYNALISALAACNDHNKAIEVYSDMLKMGVEPGIATFGSLLFASSKDYVTGLVRAQRVWSEMIASGLSPDLQCYNLLLLCFRECSTNVPDSMKVVVAAASSDDHGEEGESLSYGEDGVTSPLGDEGKDGVASSLGDEGKDGVASPLGDEGKDGVASSLGDEGKKDLERMARTEEQVLIPFYLDLAQTHKLVLSVGKKDLRWLDDVAVLLDIFNEGKMKPDIRTFHLLASLVLDNGYLVGEMEKRGVYPDGKFMVASIRTQAQHGNITEAKALLRGAEERGLNLEQMGYQAIASGCTSQHNGLQLLKEIQAAGKRPNEFVFGTLLGNAARMRKYEYLTAVLKEMRELEVLPNDVITEILESMVRDPPKNTRLMSRFNGFKGYYELWRRTMSVE